MGGFVGIALHLDSSAQTIFRSPAAMLTMLNAIGDTGLAPGAA